MKKLFLLLIAFSLNSYAAHFATGSDVPTEELNNELIKLYREDMKELPKDTFINVEGHTDSRGSDKYNKELSQRRADAVMRFFKHLHFTNIKSEGKGESQLADLGNSFESHAKNRRVVITFNKIKKVISESKECKSETVLVEKKVYRNKTVKNIISLKAINGFQNPRAQASGNVGKASVSRDTTLGIQYQRNLESNVFIGAEVDLNESLGLLIGVGF